MSSGPCEKLVGVARSRRRAANDLLGAPRASASTPALNEHTHAGGHRVRHQSRWQRRVEDA